MFVLWGFEQTKSGSKNTQLLTVFNIENLSLKYKKNQIEDKKNQTGESENILSSNSIQTQSKKSDVIINISMIVTYKYNYFFQFCNIKI